MKIIFVDKHNPSKYQINARFENSIALPKSLDLSDLPHLTINISEELREDGEIKEVYEFNVDEAAKASAQDAKELERAEEKMRNTRNALLAATDYKMASDIQATLSEEQKQALLDYRQALRDLPANTPDARSVAYPAKPE